MNLTPSPVTAALAGVFTALAWPPLWALFGGDGAPGTVELIFITLLTIALPAHAFVVGFKPAKTAGRAFDTALIKRIGAWLLAAGVTALIVAALTRQL